jgi:hypothetical protein
MIQIETFESKIIRLLYSTPTTAVSLSLGCSFRPTFIISRQRVVIAYSKSLKMNSNGNAVSDSSKAALDAAVSQVLNNNFDADSKTCLLTLLKVLDNVLQKPHDDKVRSIRLGNPVFLKKVVEKRGHHVLVACGFVATKNSQNEEFLTLDAATEDTPLIIHARHVLTQVAVHQLQCPPDTLPVFQPPKPRVELQQTTDPAGFTTTKTSTGFNIYQGRRFDGQSAAVGTNLGPPEGWKSKTEQQLSQLQQQQAKIQEKLQRAAGGRDWIVLLPGQTGAGSAEAVSTTAVPSAMNSKEDVQLLAQHIQKQQQSRTQEASRGFSTKAMRDLEQLKKTNVYSHTQLAIQFPNAVVVKANFLPQETIQAVMDGLRQSVLIENIDPPTFDLYITPPKQLLEPTKTLDEMGLVPAAKIYVSWRQQWQNSPPPIMTSDSIAWFVRPALLRQSCNQRGPAMPKSIPVVSTDDGNHNQDDDKKPAAASSSSSSSTNATANKRQKSKAEKEANLLARMMGK